MLVVAEKLTENEPKEFRYGVPPEMYSEWREVQKRIGLPQTQILHRLVKFLLDQDEVAQGMILGTLTARPDLLEYALKRTKRKRRSNADLGGHGFETINGVTRPIRRGE